jgi:PAS domain-containing protein
MTEKKPDLDDDGIPLDGPAQALRDRAEAKLKTRKRHIAESWHPPVVRQVVHDLRVHQIELEMQNEELRQKQEELDAARAKYFNLYNFAPVGYLTISAEGLILEANLTAANSLGVEKGLLANQPLTRFITAEDQDIYVPVSQTPL